MVGKNESLIFHQHLFERGYLGHTSIKTFQISKAYIPRKTIRIGHWRWLGPPTPHFCVTYTNMLVSFALGDANFSRHLTQNPNTSQWNIGCVGSLMQISRAGLVRFIFCVLISFAFGCQRKPSFQWNMGLHVFMRYRWREECLRILI